MTGRLVDLYGDTNWPCPERIREMKKTRFATMPVGMLLAALIAVQTASATVLTFDVEQDDVYVGNFKNLPDSYGDAVTAADTANGNYLQGNGWTPFITVTYLPQGGIDHATGQGTKLYGVVTENLEVSNFDFEQGTPYVDGFPSWTWGHNIGDARFYQEPRYGSTAPYAPEETWPDAGPYHCATFHKGGWAYNDLTHTILADTTYSVSVDIRGPSNDDDPAGWCGMQVYSGTAHAIFVTQAGLAEAETTSEWKTLDFSFNTADHPDSVGDIMALRLVQQDGHTGGVWHWACFDNVQAKVVDPNSAFYAARTYSDGVWDKVAMLSWDNLGYATWDFVFTPEHFNFAVVLNSFELDSYGGSAQAETGTWTVYQDDENGAVIASGSWNLGTAGDDQIVNVGMTPYAGPVLLRLTITGGTGGYMAVDNIDFDQAPVNCDGVYDGGYDLMTDVYPDCRTDMTDLHLLASDWLLDDPPDKYSDKKLVYFGWDSKMPQATSDMIDDIQHLPFDGLTIVLNASHTFYYTNDPCGAGVVMPDSIPGNSDILANMEWGRFTNNFMKMNAGLLIDWFDDAIWHEVLTNVRGIAKIAAAGGCVGVLFDPEFVYWYTPGSMWQYKPDPGHPEYGPGQKWQDSKTFEEYEAKVRQRGAQFIDTIERYMPNPVFMTLFWGSLLRERDFRTETDYYGLLNAFMLGILEGADPHTRIVDGDERAYYYASSQAYLDGYNIVKGDDTPADNNNLDNTLDMVPPDLHSKYQDQVEYGSAIFSNVTSTAYWMEFRTFWALDTSDQYVWFYAEDPIRYMDGGGIDPTMPPAIERAKAKVDAGKRLGFDK